MSASDAEVGGDEDLSHVCEFVLAPSTSKVNKISAIWSYFSEVDTSIHPDHKTWRVCLVCRRNGIDKAVNCNETKTTGCMIEHLKRHHPQEYELFLKERDEKLKMKEKLKGESAATTTDGASTVKSLSKPRSPNKKKRAASALEQPGFPSSGGKIPLVRMAPESKSEMQKLEEELDRLMKLQKMAEDRLDHISTRLQSGRSALSPFDVAMLQDRKESAVKNVHSINRKVDSLCEKLNN